MKRINSDLIGVLLVLLIALLLGNIAIGLYFDKVG